MDSSLTENQEMILFKAAKDRGGVVTMELAERMYSSNNSAESAIKKLELFNYIELKSPAVWEITKLPPDVKRELKEVMSGEEKEESEDSKAPEQREDSSDFKIEA